MENKYYRNIFILILFTFTLAGYQTYGQTFAPGFVPEGCSPLLGQFKGPAGYWDFGDGSFHLLGADAGGGRLYSAGEYNVRFKDAATSTITAVGTILVHASPAANFVVNGNISGCAPLVVNFEDITVNPKGSVISKRIWDFGPTGKESSASTSTYTYTIPGIYSVKLIVESDKGCRSIVEKNLLITVTKPPTLNFTLTKDKGCGEFLTEINNTSTGVATNATYTWKVTDPKGDSVVVGFSAAGKPNFQCTLTGSYKVKLLVKEPSGCQPVLEKAIPIVIAPNSLKLPGFSYVLTPSSGTCSSVNGEFTSLWQNSTIAGQTVNWEIEDPSGKITKRTNLPNLTGTNKVVFAATGVWKVRVTASGGTYGCPASGPMEQAITINLGQAVASFTMQDTVNCLLPHVVKFDASSSKKGVKYEWDFDNNGSIDATGLTTTKIYTTYGNKDVRLIVSDENGCKSESIKKGSIRLTALTASVGSNFTHGCNDLNGNFPVNFLDNTASALPITAWKWEFFDAANQLLHTIEGSDTAVHKNPKYTFHTVAPANKTSFWVRLTVSTAAGCTSTYTSPKDYIRVGNKPTASFNANPRFGCPNTRVDFTYLGTTPYDSLHWFPKGYSGLRYTLKSTDDPNFSYLYKESPGIYVAGLVVWNGSCSDSTHYNVGNPADPRFQQVAPLAKVSWKQTLCEQSSTTFKDLSEEAQYWRWDFGSTDVTNPYPDGKAIRDYPIGKLPIDLLNPVVNYLPGEYTAKLHVESDNVIYITDQITGENLKNTYFKQTGLETTYTNHDNGDLFWFGSLTTGDSVVFVRCTDDIKVKVPVIDYNTQNAAITSNYDPSLPNCFPVTVNFSNNTLGAVEWNWVLGNGQTSKLQNPQGIIYKTAGNYTVELEIVTAQGCHYKKAYPDYIRVKGVIANFECSKPEVCLGESMHFRDLSTFTEPIQYRTWNMGNGIIFSNDPGISNASPLPEGTAADLSNFDYTYPAVLPAPALQADGIPVTLTITETGGCKSTKTIKVRPTMPQPDFDISIASVSCDEQTVTVTVKNPAAKGYTPFRYTWQVFKKGTTSPVIASFGPDATATRAFRLKSLSATEAQEYDIRLQLEDAKYQTGKGCKAEITKTVLVQPYAFQVDFTYDLPGICPPFKVQFHDQSEPAAEIAAWDWDFGDGSPHSTVQDPLKIYQRPNPKGYSITLTVTFKNGCKNTYKNPNPIVINGILGTFTIQEIQGSVTPLPAAVLSSGATVEYVKGAFTPKEYTVQFSAVVDPEDLPKIGYYIWDFGNGSEVTTNAVVTHSYTIPNIYSPRLVIVNKQECRYDAPANLNIVANSCEAPQITALPKQCWNQTVQLKGTPSPKAIGKLKVTWTNLTDNIELYQGSGLSAIPAVSVTLTHAINISLTVTDEGGCTSYDVKNIDVYPQFEAEAGPFQQVCAGASITLSGSAQKGSGNYSYTWTADNGSTKTGTTPTFPSQAVGEHKFNLLVTDNTNQCTTKDSVLVRVNPLVEVTASEDIETCSGGSTLLNATAIGGTSQFTYQWTAGTGSDGLPSPMQALQTSNTQSTIFQWANTTTTNQTYTYLVTATDDIHCSSATDEVKVTITPFLTITLADPGIICNGSSTKLMATIVGGKGQSTNWTYEWSKVSGNRTNAEITDATAFEPTVTPTDLVTTYRLEVKETVNGQARCSASKDIIIRLSPLIVVKIDPVSPKCLGTSNIPLIAHVTGGTGSYSYEWTVTNGVLKDADKATAYIQKLDETTEYTLLIKDKNATAPQCPVEAKIKVISINPLADAGSFQNACLGKISHLQGSGLNGNAPYQYRWQLVSRPPAPANSDADGLKDADVTARIAQPEFLASNPLGMYVYALTVVDKGGCISTNLSQVAILVNPLLDAPALAGRVDYCKKETIYLSASGFPSGMFKWYTSAKLESGTLIHQGTFYQTPAVANVSYFVTQTNPATGCESPAQTIQVSVFDTPSLPKVTAPATYCQGETIVPLIARSTIKGAVVKWYSDIDLTKQLRIGDTLVTGMLSVPGSKSFYVTQQIGGCESIATAVMIRVNAIPPAPKVSSPAPYCSDETIAPLTAFGNQVQWYADATLTNKLAEGERFDTKNNRGIGKTNFYVTQTRDGCESKPATVMMEIKPAPSKPMLKPVGFCFEDSKIYTLDAGTGYVSYRWEHNNATTQKVDITEEGIYFVSLTNEWDCTVRDSVVVTELCPVRMYIPSAFTPNNDGKNDVMQVFGKHFYDMKLLIFNRWGEVVYLGNDQTEPWDGKYQGQVVAAGTYTWQFKAKAKIDNSLVEKQGVITVVR
ncbi:MAG: PKD domain-containing protein [Bacteroidota bacterium]